MDEPLETGPKNCLFSLLKELNAVPYQLKNEPGVQKK